MKYIVIIGIALLSIGAGVLLFMQSEFRAESDPEPNVDNTVTEPGDENEDNASDTENDEDTTTTNDDTETERPAQAVLGTSAGGHDITVHHFGSGDEVVLFVGGLHGGYSYNTALLAYELIDHLEQNPSLVPDDLTIAVVPTLNADGFMAAVGTTESFSASSMPTPLSARVPSRFNANDVDLNRNFGCAWESSAIWRDQTVSGGSAAFSEPETQAIRDYAAANDIRAVVAWYSAAGGVYGSQCEGSTVAETDTLVDVYADASGYPAADSFDEYSITGDMLDWFASQNVPAFSVLLSDHTSVEWNQNRAGIEALLEALTQ